MSSDGRWISSDYYRANLDLLLRHLDFQRAAIARLEREAGRANAYRAARKRLVVAKLERAIRDRMSWHEAELAKARARGFEAALDHEPRRRSIASQRSAQHAEG